MQKCKNAKACVYPCDKGMISNTFYNNDYMRLPVYDELQRLCVQSFSKPVRFWDEQNAPVSGKRFEAYLNLAQLTQQELEP